MCMSKPIPVELAVKPLYDQLTKDVYRAHASWVNAHEFTVDPTLQLKNKPFELDLTLHTIKHSDGTGDL